eukprot:COSAG03_NODE_369_length_8525_cov_21.686565_6_plen_141_part_00
MYRALGRDSMASDEQHEPLRALQVAVEHLAGKDNVPESVYIQACNAMKHIYSLAELYRVHYVSFYDDNGTVRYACNTMIVPLHNTEDDPELRRSWIDILEGASILNTIPRLPSLPVDFCGRPTMITSCEPYLKRARTEDQ